MRHGTVLGGIWVVVGAAIVLGVARLLWLIFRDPAGGYDLLPFVLLVVPLPLGLYALVGGWRLVQRHTRAPSAARGLSIICLAAGVLFFTAAVGREALPTLGRQAINGAMLALGVYGLYVERTLRSAATHR